MRPHLNTSKVSVIMPIFNAAPTLRLCLDALRRELTNGDHELICVDNGSTDGSIQIVNAFPEAILVRETKPGAYAARNCGVSVARCEVLVFTDPDCVVEPGWLESALSAFRDSSCLLALGVRRPAPDSGLNRLLGDYEIAKDRWALASNEPAKYYGFTNNMAVRRSAWELHGPFDERHRGGDTIFVRRLVEAEGCQSVVFSQGMRISHLEIDGAVTYLKKAFTYGRSLQSYSRAVPSKPLSFHNRLLVYRNACRENGYGFSKRIMLGILLLAGIAAWSLGRFAGWFHCEFGRR